MNRLLAGAFVLTVAAVAVILLAGCGSGSTTTTLHGTFTQLLFGMPVGQECGSGDVSGQFGMLGSWQVQVNVDNVQAATVPVSWQGKVYATEGTTACAGTWQATVTTAKVAYQLTVSDGGQTVTDDVSPASAGQVIALSNAAG
jgi:hypothetical protein